MARVEVVGDVPNGRARSFGMAFDRQQQLVLGVTQPDACSLFVTPAVEPPQSRAEAQQVRIRLRREFGHGLDIPQVRGVPPTSGERPTLARRGCLEPQRGSIVTRYTCKGTDRSTWENPTISPTFRRF